MKIRHTSNEFEGSPAELQEVWQQLKHLFPSNSQPTADLDMGSDTVAVPSPATDVATAEPAEPAEPGGSAPASTVQELTEVAAESFFTRRPLSKEQAAILKVVYEAGSTGATTQEISSKTGLHADTVKSYMRLLGKRVAHTPYWPKGVSVFIQAWQDGQNRYWMRPEMRAVIADGRVKL